jgi:N-acetylmuramoyl-L-alanine amidase
MSMNNHLVISLLYFAALLTPNITHCWSFFGSKQDEPLVVPIRFTLMIDPAGDAKEPGRTINDTFERGITLQLAQELKQSIEAENPGVRVILTKFPGEVIEPLQNASFANRLKVDLYLSLHVFEHKDKRNTLFLYQLQYNPADLWVKKTEDLILLPFDQAYKNSLPKTESYIDQLYESCKKETKLTCHTPLKIPFKPLVGISAPAIGIELGIKKKDDWKEIGSFLKRAIVQIITAEITHAQTDTLPYNQ